MLRHMRTTINLPDALATAAKSRAAEEGRTFTAIVEEALRALLARADTSQDPVAPLPTYGSAKATALVDLDDREAVWAALDAPDRG